MVKSISNHKSWGLAMFTSDQKQFLQKALGLVGLARRGSSRRRNNIMKESAQALECRVVMSAVVVAMSEINGADGSCENRCFEDAAADWETSGIILRRPTEKDGLIGDPTSGTEVPLSDGSRFVFDSPNSGTLFSKDGVTRRFVEIEFNSGNHGCFTESGVITTLMFAQYHGKGSAIGMFYQIDGCGFVEMYFGGREVDASLNASALSKEGASESSFLPVDLDGAEQSDQQSVVSDSENEWTDSLSYPNRFNDAPPTTFDFGPGTNAVSDFAGSPVILQPDSMTTRPSSLDAIYHRELPQHSNQKAGTTTTGNEVGRSALMRNHNHREQMGIAENGLSTTSNLAIGDDDTLDQIFTTLVAEEV
jgi:hypothetical protein